MQDALTSTDPGEQVVAVSAPFVGQWQRLVSTTNWQKGRIIGQWRESLLAEGVPAVECSDEAWARLVGGVSGQHAGRLRRVFARFGAVYERYEGLYWSHFQAALDWDDAEMWLQGASSSGWSVQAMRDERRRTLGLVEESETAADEAEVDEDAGEIADFGLRIADSRENAGFEEAQAEVRIPAAPFEGDDENENEHNESAIRNPQSAMATAPFADLPELPDDLAEAFESMKLAILRHKAQGWREVAEEDVLRMLEGLKELATAR